jgi:DNA polymerase-3 subunit delta'
MKIYGKKRALAKLSDFRRSGRFPHALLFCGAKGIGKHTLADLTAMMYMCESGGEVPCMRCNSCRRVEEHIHPDVVYPVPAIDEEFHRTSNHKSMVELMREFIASCYIRPNDGDVRVIIFEGLDGLSVQIQNTLLKFIEEPLEFNRYIFTAESRTPILRTVISRVTAVDVDPADEKDFSEAMMENGIAPERAHELFEMFGGNIGASIEFEKNGEELIHLNGALNACDAIAGGRELECLQAFLSLKTRDDIFKALDIMTDIFARAAALKTGVSLTGAYKKQVGSISSRFSLAAITRLYDESVRLGGMSFTNPNVKLFAAECCGSLFSAAERQ